MKFKIILIILIAVIQVSCPGNSKPKESSVESVKWESFDTGLIKAKEQKKSIVIDFYADWCHWCKVMDKETFSNKEVIKILSENFIAIRLNTEKNDKINYMGMETTPNGLASAVGVKGLPTVLFMDKDGKPIDLVPGFIKPEMFTAILRYVNEECYKKQVSFQDYMDKKADCN
ncbi:MAG: DUF255 domain-containing protein [Spirochaetes bacterium]|nr:DUF255 domain-containing protein [Spirochaetota bacterium]